MIDIQTDEAPLILKKSNFTDKHNKCASCNQFKFNESSPKEVLRDLSNSNSRIKLNQIQDISQKLGFGSYSKLLNYCQPETLNSELKDPKGKHSHNTSLPNINYILKKKINTTNLNNTNYNGNSNINSNINSMATTLISQERFGPFISQEIEKKNLKAESLIKIVDKVHDKLSGNLVTDKK